LVLRCLGRGDDARVDQLPGHGEIARAAELPIEQLEQALDGPGFGQRLTKGPDGVGVRNGIAQPKPEKPHPGQPVAQVELGALVTEVVLGLQDQDLEHQDVVERRPAALGAIRPWHGALELGPEQLEVDHRREPLQVVTFPRQPGQPFLDVEQPGRTPHPDPPQLHATVEQIRPASPRFLEVSI
jgi:hypothetical protein